MTKTSDVLTFAIICAIATKATDNFARFAKVPNKKELVITQTAANLKPGERQ